MRHSMGIPAQILAGGKPSLAERIGKMTSVTRQPHLPRQKSTIEQTSGSRSPYDLLWLSAYRYVEAANDQASGILNNPWCGREPAPCRCNGGG